MTPRRRDGLFRALLRLFPSDMRESHGREMEQVLREQHRQRRPGLAASLVFWLGAIYDVLRVAPRQHAEALSQDVRYALRGLRRTPAFAVVALATIALGTGATSAVFAVVNSVLIRPLPYEDAERTALVWAVTPDGTRTWLSPPELDDIRERVSSLDEVAGLTDLRFALTGGGAPEEVNVVGASANLFPMLGTHPVIGRLFQPSDDVENATRVVVLGHGLWARRFGMSPAVLGTTMMLDGRPYTVVGVLPKGFGIVPPSPVFPARVDAWVTLQTHLPTRARDVRFLHAVARVRRDVELGSAREEVATIGPALSREFSDAYRGGTWNFDLVSLQADVVRSVKPALLILLATVGLVLLIAAANVATLLLVRGESRRREMAIRIAVGASSSRLIRQLLTEGLVLALLGGALGLVLAGLAPAVARSQALAPLPRFADVRIDWHVVAFACLVSCATAVLFTLAPALQRCDGREAMAPVTSRRSVRIGRALAAAEIAFAAMVLVVALMLGRSFARILDASPGFESTQLISARIGLSATYPSREDVNRFFDQSLERLSGMPGVESAAAVSQLPLSGSALGSTFTSGVDASGEPLRIDGDLRGVTTGYFETMGIQLLEGRTITPTDAATTPFVAVIDELMAKRLSPDGRAVGRRIRWIRQPEIEIQVVGIVRPVRHSSLDQDPRPTVYRPHTQYPRWSMYVVARVSGDAARSAQALTSAVHEVDPNQPVSDVATMESLVSRSIAQPGFGAASGFALAALALSLAGVGVYGLLAFAVAQRKREVGIRLAVGASRLQILRLLVTDGARLALIGVAAGAAGAVALGRWISSVVPGAGPMDGAIVLIAAGTVMASAFLASWVPARRASQADPSVVLRADV
jgi:putative ABC transport system permease protein